MARETDSDARELNAVIAQIRFTIDYMESCGVLPQIITVLRTGIQHAVENGDHKDLRFTHRELKQWIGTLPEPKQAEFASMLAGEFGAEPSGRIPPPVTGGIASEDEYYAVAERLSNLVSLDVSSPTRALLEAMAFEYEESRSVRDPLFRRGLAPDEH